MKTAFLKNAAILTVTSLLLRMVGMLFRIYMSNTIGAEGMGLYQLIVSVYVLVSTFATSGISTAVTRLVTDELVKGSRASLKRLMGIAVAISVGIGLISFAAIALAAEPIAVWCIKDARAIPALRILGAGLPFMGLSSCIKGYFIARRRVAGNSVAQLLEQAVRIGCIGWLLSRFGGTDAATACACILIGDTVAETLSCLYMCLCYLRDGHRLRQCLPAAGARRPVLRPLAAIAVPLAAGRYLTTFLHTAENLLVPRRLALYSGSQEQALSSFGTLKGMAMPLLFFPASFLSAFSTLLVPEMTEAQARGQTQKVRWAAERTLHLTLWASIGFTGVFVVLAYPLGQLLYKSEEVGFLLTVLAPLIPAMYAESVADGLLKGLGQQISTLKVHVIDSAVRIVLILLLVPRFGIAGFLFVMIVSNLLSSFLNLHHLLHVTGARPPIWRCICGPALATTVAGFGVHTLTPLLGIDTSSTLYLVLAAAGMLGAYLLLTWLLGCIGRQDLQGFSASQRREDAAIVTYEPHSPLLPLDRIG